MAYQETRDIRAEPKDAYGERDEQLVFSYDIDVDSARIVNSKAFTVGGRPEMPDGHTIVAAPRKPRTHWLVGPLAITGADVWLTPVQ